MNSFFQSVPKGVFSGISGGAPRFDLNKSFTTDLGDSSSNFGNASRAGGFLDKAKSGPNQGSWQDAAKTFGGMLSNIGEGRKAVERRAGEVFNRGYPMYGNAQSLGDGLAIYNPPTMAPIVIGGASAPEKGTGQRIAGAGGGALSGAATGAAFGPVGAVAGGLIGGVGGFFS